MWCAGVALPWNRIRILEPDFLVPSAQHFEGYADTTLVVAYEGDTFRGVLPIVRMERARIPPRMLACTNGRPLPFAVWARRWWMRTPPIWFWALFSIPPNGRQRRGVGPESSSCAWTATVR